MDALFTRRGRAYLRDCVGYLGLVALTVPAGLTLRWTGWTPTQESVVTLSAVAPVVATVLAARRESGPGAATPGKRRTGLRVTALGGPPPSFGRALLRNTVKIAVPWQLGHVVAVGASFGAFDDPSPTFMATVGATYGLLAALVFSVALRPGRGLHDRAAGTRVVANAT